MLATVCSSWLGLCITHVLRICVVMSARLMVSDMMCV